MKKIWMAVLAGVLLCLCLGGCNSDKDAPTGYKTASGEAADYTFFVPQGWTVDLSTGATTAYCSLEDPSSISVMAWELPHTDTTVDAWWAMHLEEISLVFQDVQMAEPENVTLDGVYAQKYVYTARLGSFSYQIQQTAAVKNGSVYLVTYTALADSYDAHLEEVNAMLSFFRFS